MPTELRALLFDLDGTFADTAPDLVAALNQARADESLPPLPTAALRPWVSTGTSALVQRAFDTDAADTRFPERRARFLAHYAAALTRHTRLFPAVARLVLLAEARQIAWGIVTNKRAALTEPLMQQLGYAQRAACIVSGDTTPHPKPHPAPLLHACAQIGCHPSQALYLGDARRDIEAGQRAGLVTVAVGFGYIEPGDDPACWGADFYLATPQALETWFLDYLSQLDS